MYCPNCKQNFEDIDFCPCCVDDNGDSIKLIPAPAEESEFDNGQINIDKPTLMSPTLMSPKIVSQ